MEKISASQAAKLLGIAVDKLEILEKQGLIHSIRNIEGASFYSSGEITQIKSRRGPTLAEEAAQVGTEIQQEVFTSVSGLVKLRKRASVLGAGLFAVFTLLLIVITALFYKYPLATSDFFGYYYRFNATGKLQALSTTAQEKNVLGVTTGPDAVPVKTSVLADVIKPVAATSLVLIKAVDNQKYQQIATDPFLGTGQAGPPGSQGAPGVNGTNGSNGADGLPGLQGTVGSNGANGTNGSNGSNGTSVADVLTAIGDLTIRDGANTTSRLAAGTNGQVLTISGGIPAWENSSGLSVFSGITGGTNTTAAMLIGTGASLGPTGSGTVTANSFSGSGLTTSNFSSANISQWTNNSGYITTSTTDTLTNKSISGSTNTFSNIPNSALTNSALTVSAGTGLTSGGLVSLGGTVTLSLPSVGTAGAYGSATTIPVITTDAQGRVSGVTATGISGLTASNLTAGDFSSKITSGTYSIDISGNAATATTATSANSATTATNFSGSLAGDVTGIQGSTTVAKINGAVLGTTTATSGNLLIGSGTQWVTQALSNDATINSSGALTLKNTGTAGTYGSATNIPVFVTDAQGRVASVTNTAISGLTVSNFGSANISQWTNNSGYLTSEADTLASVTGRGATTATALTLSNISNAITSGTLTATGGTINGTTIGATSPSTGVFTTINGLTITNNGTNTLTIAAGKTLTVNSSITFGGTDGTSFTLPSSSDTLVGRSSTDTLTNKTIAAGSNTISGLTVSNFTSPNISQWTNNSGYLTSEADTLATVTGRGASTSTALTLNGGVTTTTSTALTLDSGTTGGVSIGTGANAKIVTIGNTTGATAMNINSGTGNINLTVDSTATSGKVQIGNSGTATPDLLVLDNGTADPTGVNGGTYYNTSTGKFRCFENSAWANCIGSGSGTGSDLQHAASYDTNEALTNIPGATQVVLGTVSVTPTSATGDVYATGFAEVRSSNATDQPFTLVIETTSNCTGTTVGNASVTYTVTSGVSTTVHLGNIRVSGIAVDPGTSAQPYSLCASVSAGDTDVLNWGIEALVIDTGADLAEIYTTNDASIEVGDVVSLDPGLQTGMKKSQKAYDQSVLGIVSTRPGLVIGNVDKEGVKALPVALSGRVPVKVSTENGPVKFGDYLTSSSTPGVAMKAIKAGAIIGTAMSPFEGEGIGQILAFVKNGSSMGSNSDNVNSIDVLTQWLNQPNSNFGNEEASSSAQAVKAENVIKTNILDLIAQAISDVFKNTVEFFGNVIFHADVTFLGRPTFNKDTVGHALIKQGETEVSIDFKKEYTNQPVVNVNVNMVGAVKPDEIPSYAVYDLSTKGFKIKLSKTTTFDLNFSWVALGVNEDNVSTSNVSATPLPSPNPTIIPSVTPSPSLEITSSPTATESASPSAQPIP